MARFVAEITRSRVRLRSLGADPSVRRWLPPAAITVLGDQACSVVELAHACR